MYVSAIVLAAGRGLRLKSKIPKPLVKINREPLFVYCLECLSKHPWIKDIILVVNAKNLKDISKKIKQYGIGKIRNLVLGARTRSGSVFCGLQKVNPRADFVLIHDAARPFINKRVISVVIKEAKRYGAAILGVPVRATVKKIKNQKSKIKIIERTVKRDDLWEIQTPQVFRRDLILQAYEKFGDIDATDDAVLVEKLGRQVSVVKGSYNNIKITTPEDLVIAEAIAKSKNF